MMKVNFNDFRLFYMGEELTIVGAEYSFERLTERHFLDALCVIDGRIKYFEIPIEDLEVKHK